MSMNLRELLAAYLPLEAKEHLLSSTRAWIADTFPRVSSVPVGLVALADISAVARRTALTGTSSLWDCLVLCPGLHKQQNASELNREEYPICAAMTTDYVFRVENQATVLYLQSVGRTGHLTSLSVVDKNSSIGFSIPAVAYSVAPMLTFVVLILLILLNDWWGLLVVSLMILVRLINVVVVQRRTIMGWKGAPEPGKQSDLIILLSQDKWIRLKGAVDDVKGITSGAWMREATFFESGCVGLATLLTYLDAGLSVNASQEGKLLLAILLFSSSGILGLVNEYTDVFTTYGRKVQLDGPRKDYGRRLDLAKDLVKETGRREWAIRLDMAKREDLKSIEENSSINANPPGHAKDEDRPVIL